MKDTSLERVESPDRAMEPLAVGGWLPVTGEGQGKIETEETTRTGTKE
jgi:hypothetical protein